VSEFHSPYLILHYPIADHTTRGTSFRQGYWHTRGVKRNGAVCCEILELLVQTWNCGFTCNRCVRWSNFSYSNDCYKTFSRTKMEELQNDWYMNSC